MFGFLCAMHCLTIRVSFNELKTTLSVIRFLVRSVLGDSNSVGGQYLNANNVGCDAEYLTTSTDGLELITTKC